MVPAVIAGLRRPQHLAASDRRAAARWKGAQHCPSLVRLGLRRDERCAINTHTSGRGRRLVGRGLPQLPQCALPCALQRPQQRRPILLPRAAAARTPAVRLGWRSGCPRRAWKAFDVGWGARVRAWAYRCLRCLSWCGGGVSNAGAERSPKMSTAARGLTGMLTGMPYRNRNITCRNITCRN